MRIVQITDSHVTARGTLWKGALDTGDRLARQVAAVNAMDADLVVHTGDLVEDGAGPEGPAQYDRAAAILAGLTAPLRLLPGNHDGRAAMRAAFPGQDWRGAPYLNFAQDAAGLNLIGLDSVAQGETGGELDAARLDWLGAALDDRPALIFLHHPPCPMDLPFMDAFGFRGTADLAARLSGRRILRLACGHVHADAEVHWAGTLVAAAEAASVQIPPDLPALAGQPNSKLRRVGIEPLRLRFFDWGPAGLSVKTVLAEPSRDQLTM